MKVKEYSKTGYQRKRPFLEPKIGFPVFD